MKFTPSFFSFTSDIPTAVIGEHLRQQVEDRLKFYETGENPAKNIDVMKIAVGEVSDNNLCQVVVSGY